MQVRLTSVLNKSSAGVFCPKLLASAVLLFACPVSVDAQDVPSLSGTQQRAIERGPGGRFFVPRDLDRSGGGSFRASSHTIGAPVASAQASGLKSEPAKTSVGSMNAGSISNSHQRAIERGPGGAFGVDSQ